MHKIELHKVVKRFGQNTVCDGVDLTVAKNKMVCLIGASGAGKSTLLRCINLLEPIEDGEIFLDGEDISIPGLNPQRVRAKIGMVFQNFNLFPHMTAYENAILAPRRVHGLSKLQLQSEIEKSVTAGIMANNPIASFTPGDMSKENYAEIDLHRHLMDKVVLVIPSGKPMNRESDLIDVWFDSGSMPYAQWH